MGRDKFFLELPLIIEFGLCGDCRRIEHHPAAYLGHADLDCILAAGNGPILMVHDSMIPMVCITHMLVCVILLFDLVADKPEIQFLISSYFLSLNTFSKGKRISKLYKQALSQLMGSLKLWT